MEVQMQVRPFRKERTVIRNNTPYKIVRGRNKEGMSYYWIEIGLPDVNGIRKALYWKGMDVQAIPPKRGDTIIGVVKHIVTIWGECLMANGEYLIEETQECKIFKSYMKTNDPDLVGFSEVQGDENGDHFINGAFREILGFNDQPPYKFSMTTFRMEDVDDALYDTTKPPIGGYELMTANIEVISDDTI
jgi:hypothetical protein